MSFGISTVATYRFSSLSKMHVSRADLVATFGEIKFSLDMKSLWLLSPATFLPFRVQSLFSLRQRWHYRIVFLCSSVKSFLCRVMNVSLVWFWFISEWTAHMPFLPRFLRPDFSESWGILTEVTSGSFCTSPWLNNTWSSVCRTWFSAIFQPRVHSGSLTWLGYRTWYFLLLWKICALLRWDGWVYLYWYLMVGLWLLWDIQVVTWVPVPVLWVSRGWCLGQCWDLVLLAPHLPILLHGTLQEVIVGPYFFFYHHRPYPLLCSWCIQ